jgi:tetratricopeptide (TPR) repeat protein
MGWPLTGAALVSACLYSISLWYLSAELVLRRWPCALPSTPLSSLRCAERQEREGRPARALKEYEKALAAGPPSPGVRAQILLSLGLLQTDPAAARERITEAATFSPEEVRRKALWLQSRGRLDSALMLWKQLLRQAPDSSEDLGGLGITRALLGSEDDALRDLMRAAALDPTNVGARYSLGVILERRGERKAALAAYVGAVSAVERYPDHMWPGFSLYLGMARQACARLAGKTFAKERCTL